ncbi:MAG: lysylphosphatidylglycerol synthase domain-containing protein, partial [Candidatus Aenigmatarchaeota archaeon]
MRAAAGFVVGLSIIAFIFYRIGFASILSAFSTANPSYLATAILITPLIILLQSFKLKKIVESQKYSLAFGESVR